MAGTGANEVPNVQTVSDQLTTLTGFLNSCQLDQLRGWQQDRNGTSPYVRGWQQDRNGTSWYADMYGLSNSALYTSGNVQHQKNRKNQKKN